MQTTLITKKGGIEFYETILAREERRKRKFVTCQACEGAGIEFDEERPGNCARVCPQCNGEGWVVK